MPVGPTNLDRRRRTHLDAAQVGQQLGIPNGRACRSSVDHDALIRVRDPAHEKRRFLVLLIFRVGQRLLPARILDFQAELVVDVGDVEPRR